MYKFTLRIFLFLCILGIASSNSFGQFISAGGSPYTENFDGMSTSATATLPGGWKADAVTTVRTVSSYLTAGTTTQYNGGANMASNNGNGGIYNFGDGTTAIGGTDRALGGLNTSNNPTSINAYLQLTNNAATAITQVAVAYDIEKYRNGKNTDSTAVQLYYSSDGIHWVNAGPAFYTAFAPDADNDGYATAPGSFVHVSAVYNLPAAVTQSNSLYFAWNISASVSAIGANASNSPALGIDNVRIAATAAAPTALYFRSVASGNWSDVNIWEFSSDNSTWNAPPAPHYPSSFDRNITVQSGHVVMGDVSVLTDETTVFGTLTINPGITIAVNDGPLFDLTVPGGTINGTGSLVIKSVSTGGDDGTASFGPSTGGTVSVPTTVERLISYNPAAPRSAWRFLTAPLTGTGSIYDTWQNGGIYAAGIGTTVTGPTYTGAGTPGNPAPNGSTGLDYYTAAPSLYTFDAATQTIVPVTNTKTTLLSDPTANTGYYIFINGDRQSAWGTPNQTTLSATGSLMIGAKNFVTTAAANAITLVGNPYASAVDLAKFDADNAATSNVKSSYYYWDPYLTGWYGVGGYVTVSYAGGVQTITPDAGGGGSHETQYLQSGQAMFVQTKSAGGGGTVTFNEVQKDPTSINSIFRVQSATTDNLRVNLKVVSGAASLLVDGIVASFNNSYSPKVDDMDATKLQNPGESIAFMREDKAFAIERLPLSSETVLNLNLYRLKPNAAYQFEITPSISTAGLTAYLTDSYLKTTTTIDLTKPTIVSFTANSDAASTGANRFTISFAKPAAIAVGEAGLSVFPNPVTNGIINLQMKNMPQGIYNVRLFNSMGQVVLTRQINHAAGSSTETIQVGKGMAKGVLQLEVVKPDNTKFASRVIAN